MNELLIKPDLSDSTEEKEEDEVEESAEEENGSKADCVFTAASLETALKLVISPQKSPKKAFSLLLRSNYFCWFCG